MIADRRGEAHLWLLLEEALLHVRRADVEPWEAWRNFRAVVDALVVTGALGTEVGEAMVAELDDALALRGVVPAAAFTAAPWPELDALTAPRPAPPARAAETWLEAEVERHLDLFVSFGIDAQAWAAADLVRIVGGPVRAFAAVGMIAEDHRILEEVIASLDAAGIPVPRPPVEGAAPREAWVSFLRARPGPLPMPHDARQRRRPRLDLGRLGPASVRLDDVAWSEDALEVGVAVRGRSTDPRAASVAERTPWHARVEDDGGRLHLGQPVTARPGTAVLRFALRPGLPDDVERLEVRLTRGGERIDASVAL